MQTVKRITLCEWKCNNLPKSWYGPLPIRSRNVDGVKRISNRYWTLQSNWILNKNFIVFWFDELA